MNIDKEREAFEAKHPIPKGIAWIDGRYQLIEDIQPLWLYVYLSKWEAWKARAAANPVTISALLDETDHLRAELTRQWKPIETAPKDGREFLACWTRQGNVIQIANWNRIHGFWASKGEPIPSFYVNATHWAELPAPPQGGIELYELGASIEGVAALDEQNAEPSDPLTDFEEGQWWIKELDALVATGNLTNDQVRAVAVVHNMLRAVKSIAPKGEPPLRCMGENCGAINAKDHSPECILQAAKTRGWLDSPEADEARSAISKPTECRSKVHPSYWTYIVNGHHRAFSPIEPPDDAYDEGTLEPLYAAPVNGQDAKDAALPGMLTDLRYHSEFLRGWNACLTECPAAIAPQGKEE